MKRLFKGLLLSLFLCCFVVYPTFAQPPTSEQITLFKTEIVQEQNTDIHITEEIHYYFPTYRHGIIREIPTSYKVQASFRRPTILTLDQIYYYDKQNPNDRYDRYERSSSSGYAVFKIGDPEQTIQGEYVYVIKYTLKNAVNYFDDHDELYLNITGNGWNIPIMQAESTIKVPGKILDKVCYTGSTGSTASDCTFENIDNNSVKVTVNNPLGSSEGYTVALKMPKGSLEDTTKKQMFEFLISNIGILLPIPIFIFLASLVKNKGRNKKITVIPHYEKPKGLYPLLAGYIYKKTLNSRHITAQIIQLAIDGHILIKQEGKRNYTLVKDHRGGDIDLEMPRTLYTGLFKGKDEVSTKKINSNFYLTVNSLNSSLSKTVYSDKYFSNERKKLQTTMLVLGIVGLCVSFALIAPLSFIAAGGWILGMLLSSALIFIFAFQVDLRAQKGNEIYYELEGLKMYIKTAEKHRIEFHNNPKKWRGVFENLLPYAIIFGLEKKWAKEFEDIYNEPPSWYEGDIYSFNPYLLTNSITDMNKNVNNAGGFASSHGGSGGSGFDGGSSGGGFGGGGGGSW
jgi:uncharacterized membrane protein YgcG